MDYETLNNLLETQSYVGGHEFSDQDLNIFNTIKTPLPETCLHLARWFNHISIFNHNKMPGASKEKKPVANKKIVDKNEKHGEKESTALKGELNPLPPFLSERLQLWDKLKAEYDEFLVNQPKKEIKITLPDGSIKNGLSWQTTPIDIATSISKGLADTTIVAKVDGIVWDLDRPLEGDCSLQLLKFNDDEAKTVFWHSTAHVLGESLERVYGGLLCYGPPIEEGFYYDMFCEDKVVSNLDFPVIEDSMKKMVKEKQTFERLEMKKSDLLKMFEYNPFKVRILNEKVKTDTTTVYRCGTLIDLCRGPHVRHTGKLKSLAVTKSSAAYWEGNQNAESLQRVYGISYPDSKQLKEWQHFQAEAAKRDHRKIGVQQKLFFFHELSPGSCFFTPKGTFIYNQLVNLMKDEYSKRGFDEVTTPNIYKKKVWETSGHWNHYSNDMFSFEVEKDTYALKPMNCPGHCLLFGHTTRSWKELPIRMADFGVLHRNEASGALTGLTRVRRFQQDDAHIFCAPNMIKQEMKGCFEFLSAIYEIFDFKFDLQLSTRPEKFLGEIEVWNRAEEQLKESLDEFGSPWKLNPGDGAFYGPKIDITVTDALRRHHQCATIQLDFQLPERFDLNYMSETGENRRPVIIHRAILGSVERMIAILTENYGGKWPFWLSPRQVMVVPVNKILNDYAKSVCDQLKQLKFQAECDIDDSNTMNKKIRDAQLEQFNFILVVGDKEFTNNTVNVRTRDNKVHGELSLDDLKAKLHYLRQNRTATWDEA